MRALRIIAGLIVAALGATSIEWALFEMFPAVEKIHNTIEPRLRNIIEAFNDYLHYGGELRIYADNISHDINDLIIHPVLKITQAIVLGFMLLQKSANYIAERDISVMDELDDFLSRKNKCLR